MNNEVPIVSEEVVQSAEYKAASRRLNRKMDVALLPFLSLLYLFNGLDRSNVGNAETQGVYFLYRLRSHSRLLHRRV